MGNKLFPALLVLTLFLPAPSNAFPASPAAPDPETLTFGRFGKVTLYRPATQPRHVVLFLSGDGGWNQGVIDMARILAGMDAAVAGISTPHLLRQIARSNETCSYPASDLETLGKIVERRYGFEHYVPPVLVGYSSGATLVYAALAQAPPATFRGGISLGFCPDLPLVRPFCSGHGLTGLPGPRGKGIVFQPARLETPWIAFQGDADQVCSKELSVRYTEQTPGSELILLPKVGHGFSVESRWVPQFRESFQRLTREDAGGVKPAGGAGETGPVRDLPLVEVPARQPGGDTLAVVLSGDGGWAGLDKEIAGELAGRGVAVVGLNSLQYFWKARTPEESGHDLERILRHYLPAWHRDKVLLVGYSLGADVLPFLARRLPPDLLERIRLIALLGPDRTAELEFHLSEWLGGGEEAGRPVLPELKKLAGRPIVCVYGKAESDSLCPEVNPPLGKSIGLEGAHHFGGDYQAVADLLLREAQLGGSR